MRNIIAEIRRRVDAMPEREQVIIAIDGSCTAGKSTLAQALRHEFDCNLFHIDDFFLRPEQRTVTRLKETGGNVDYERFREEVLLPLKTGKPFSYRPYDCTFAGLKSPVTVEPKRISIVEGSYSHHPSFGEAYDLRIFLKVTPEIRKQRILQRPEFLQKRFFEEWIPMEQQYFSEYSIEEKADLAVMPEDNA